MEPAVLREDLVDGLEHESKGWVTTERVSRAMRTVPREVFLEDDRAAYADRSFDRPGTRVLSPSTVARLLEALDAREDDSVLVVGVGVGYTAAVLAEIAGASNVQAVDISRPLVLEARSNLGEAGYGAVLIDRRDGANGLPPYAPYDRILVEAAAVNPPAALRSQLAADGRLVMPQGAGAQTLVAFEDGSRVAELGPVSFRPLLVEGEGAHSRERNRTRREDRERARRAGRAGAGWEHRWIDWDGASPEDSGRSARRGRRATSVGARPRRPARRCWRAGRRTRRSVAV